MKSRKTDLRTIRRVALAFKPYWWQLILVFFAIIVSMLLNLVVPLTVRAIFDEAIGRRNLSRLVFYTILLFVAPVIGNLIGMWQTILNTKAAQNVVRDLRIRLYTHLQYLSLRFFTDTSAGQIQSRLTNDISGIQGVITNTASSVVGNLTTVVGAMLAMLYISPILTIALLGLMPVFLVISYYVGRARRGITKTRQENLASLSVLIQETLSVSGMLLIKTFGQQNYTREKFAQKNQKLVEIEIRQQIVGRWGMLGYGIVSSAVPALVFLVAGWQLIRGVPIFGATMTIGSIAAFTQLMGRLFVPAGQLFGVQVEVQAGLAMFDRIFEYLDLPIEIVDKPGAVNLDHTNVLGEIEFANVSFNYRRDAHVHVASGGTLLADSGVKQMLRPTLKNVSFHIKSDQVVALVGPSGAGKTTIGYLIPRLYDVDSGMIKIDGRDVRDISLASLTNLIGVVSQETYLLNASIRENLLVGQSRATETAMIEAAKAAAIHENILKCKHGYDTIVGERGYKLSGGEKQRLAIARVILKDPRILILDEATSALDTHSEYLVQQVINRLMRGRTTLVIAHRLSTIMAANLILVLDKGEIVESGNHSELLSRGEMYARLYQQNFASNSPHSSGSKDDIDFYSTLDV